MKKQSSRQFKKWDIVYFSRIPDTIKCFKCHNSFTLDTHVCPHCKQNNKLSNHISKPRPFLLCIDQKNWIESMTLGIPLSTSHLFNITATTAHIKKTDYVFLHTDQKYYQPMRAVIHQVTRLNGNVIRSEDLIGEINNKSVIDEIENKLLDWVFK